MCHSVSKLGNHFRNLLTRRSIASRHRLAGIDRTKTGHTSLRTLATERIPSSPIIVSDLSLGAAKLQVTRATAPPGYSMHPTVKSGAIVSTAMPLSLIRHDAND